MAAVLLFCCFSDGLFLLTRTTDAALVQYSSSNGSFEVLYCTVLYTVVISF